MKLEVWSLILSVFAMVVSLTVLFFSHEAAKLTQEAAKQMSSALKGMRTLTPTSHRKPYPGENDYPWPTVGKLLQIPREERDTCVCGRPIVLWEYPRQGRADGTETWWVHTENARRSVHPVDGPRRHQGFAMPQKKPAAVE